ncbi:MAG: SIS domain-containing protein [Actinomycetota bacterium]|nr:SIS domain-containing protein [Actinomycetota bacterium]MDH5224942.1 SIS domain-containing protein [Actinomycetota bacterium]MDH5313008.1 SIS domain-containing protein [Actinomycetota bacterium]
MNPEAFLADLERKPEMLRALADFLDAGSPWPSVAPTRVVMIGMGSSRYAAGVVATRLRAAGIDACAEYASLERGTPAGSGVLAVGISAGGSTEETIEALAKHRGSSDTVALTNRVGASIERAADSVVPMLAGDEDGGVACRSFQHTLVSLMVLEAALTGGTVASVADVVRRTAAATEDLLDRRDAWLPGVADLLGEGSATFAVAPAERLASAEQGALMFREGPRRTADACEAGDWLHVDVYLTKPLDYRALVFAGSRFDAAIMAWMRDRGARVVAVGRDVGDADVVVRYRHDDEPQVALLTEVLIAELVAARWWTARGDA